MRDYVYMVAVVLAFGAGAWLTSAHYDREIALMEAAQSDALRAAERKMQKDFRKQRTRSIWHRLSTTICAVSLIGLVQGCATQTVAEAPKEIPQTLLVEELPSWKAWFESWLTLVQSAADCISGAPPTTTLSQP